MEKSRKCAWGLVGGIILLGWWFASDPSNPAGAQGARGEEVTETTAAIAIPFAGTSGTASAARHEKANIRPPGPIAHSPVNGYWVGALDIAREGSTTFSFRFMQIDRRLVGSASFPLGTTKIEEGTIDDRRLSFVTRHRLEPNGETLVSQFSGSVDEGGVISLTMVSEGLVSRFTVRRMSDHM